MSKDKVTLHDIGEVLDRARAAHDLIDTIYTWCCDQQAGDTIDPLKILDRIKEEIDEQYFEVEP